MVQARTTIAATLLATALIVSTAARAGAQIEERLAPSVATVLSHAISDSPVPSRYAEGLQVRTWLTAMSPRLATRIPDVRERQDFLATAHYEATRAGLDPQLLLAIIQHESGFKKYAVSTAGARGYLQVMPFWTRLIGSGENNLFHLRTNLRYGCVIMRHYLDMEGGDLYRALGRYNGSLGRPEYPGAVLANLNRFWLYEPAQVSATPHAPVTSAPFTRAATPVAALGPLGVLAAQAAVR
ncbi:MAG: lytic transglycosylase domain-containing protein [Casimicrobiaceae bacterium]